MSDELESAFRYRNRAEEIRAIAADTGDPGMRRTLLGIADDYEKMAQTLERIAARQPTTFSGRKNNK